LAAVWSRGYTSVAKVRVPARWHALAAADRGQAGALGGDVDADAVDHRATAAGGVGDLEGVRARWDVEEPDPRPAVDRSGDAQGLVGDDVTQDAEHERADAGRRLEGVDQDDVGDRHVDERHAVAAHQLGEDHAGAGQRGPPQGGRLPARVDVGHHRLVGGDRGRRDLDRQAAGRAVVGAAGET
jgi:hypothetical protein